MSRKVKIIPVLLLFAAFFALLLGVPWLVSCGPACENCALDPYESHADLDQDGVPAGEDCSDTNADVYPGAEEICDGIDNDCDGIIDPSPDEDGDGYSSCPADQNEMDCDDEDELRYPGAEEICDGIDNDCDEAIDEDFDTDHDGSTTCDSSPDCDDEDPGNYPGNVEICDGIDNNCNGEIDESIDLDGDGFPGCGSISDCDDRDDWTYPEATELCDDVDNDCDGEIDEKSQEICDGVDNDCNGIIDDNLVEESTNNLPGETESNDSLYDADWIGDISFGVVIEVNGTIASEDDVDWYSFTLPDDDLDDMTLVVRLDDIPLYSNYDLIVYDDAGEALGVGDAEGNTSEVIMLHEFEGEGLSFLALEVLSADGSYGCPHYTLSLWLEEE